MAATTKHTVFISHAHADNEQCDAYAKGLKDLGLDVWYDRDNMQASNLIADIVSKELKARTALVLLLTPNAVNSGWVKAEWQTFFNYWTKEQDKRIIVPVILSDCEAPPLLTPFNQVNLSLMTRDEAIDTIARTLGVEPPPRRAYPVAQTFPRSGASEPQPSHWWQRRRPTIAPTQESGWPGYLGYDADNTPTTLDIAELQKAFQAIGEWLMYTEEKWRAVNDSQLGWKPLRGRWNGWEEIYQDVFPPQKHDTNDPMDRRLENAKSKGSAASAVVGMLHDLESLRRMLQYLNEHGSLPASSGRAPAQPSARTGKQPVVRSSQMIVDADDDYGRAPILRNPMIVDVDETGPRPIIRRPPNLDDR